MAFHWAIVITLGLSIWYAYSRGFIPRKGPGLDPDIQRELRRAIMTVHFDWSWVVTGLVALRIFWQFLTVKPRMINDDHRLILVHKLVIGALAWMPILLTVSGVGVIMSVARDTKAFGITVVPGFAERNEELHDIMEVLHVGLWYFFAALALLHIAAALWHHVKKQDETLKRMVPWGKVN